MSDKVDAARAALQRHFSDGPMMGAALVTVFEAAIRAESEATVAAVVRILQAYEHGRMIDGDELLARMRDRAALAATPEAER